MGEEMIRLMREKEMGEVEQSFCWLPRFIRVPQEDSEGFNLESKTYLIWFGYVNRTTLASTRWGPFIEYYYEYEVIT